MASAIRLVACVNKRLGTGQRSCVDSGNLDYIAEIETLIAQAGLDIAIIKRECLGKCEQGPVMRIAPGGRFFTEINQTSLPVIVSEIKMLVAERDETDGVDGPS
jgi:(2Fe-2S) ferredoxin